MIRWLIEYSIRNRAVILLLVSMAVLWGVWSIEETPLDAIPDISDTQVIIYTEWQGQSPDIIEDQITYPITSTLLSAPRVEVVRGYSFLGISFVYVIFEDGTDIYWARSRVLEYLQSIKDKLPQGVTPVLGPDATSVGWGFSYALIDRTNSYSLADLRTLQDWYIKYAIESVEGVAEVASIGGFVKQFQVVVDPNKLLAYDVSLQDVLRAVKASNRDVAARVMELSGIEYMIRGRGYVKSLEDLENIALKNDERGVPVLLRDVARVQIGPDIRRGLADLNGEGEVVGGIVVVRFGENMLDVLSDVKEKIKEIKPSLPEGIEIVTTYDRSDLIRSSINTLWKEILKLTLAVLVVCLVFLGHLRSALIVILTLPVAILSSFVIMKRMMITSNIMSLSGIAIAIGAMVDASIVIVENVHKHLADWRRTGGKAQRMEVMKEAILEVAPSLFFSLLVITISFLPIFALQKESGRLFKPLAYTKTLSMVFASFLSITLTPVLITLFLRGRYSAEHEGLVNRALIGLYHRVMEFVLKRKAMVVMVTLFVLVITLYPIRMIGSEFMPPLYEGSLFYMPVTMPGASITEVSRLLQIQDRILKSFPEVAQVFGKAGRAETATDPAPLEMFETVINLKPPSQWRKGMTVKKLIEEMNEALTIPGVSNSFTMPIKARIDMLSTGLRTPVGLKITGPDINELEQIGKRVERVLKDVQGTRNVYADRINTGYYIDIVPDRVELARYALTIDDVMEVVESAIGGKNVSVLINGRERYPINIRYPRDLRSDLNQLKRVLVSLPRRSDSPISAQVPIAEVADIKVTKGPSLIKSEDGMPISYVYIDFSGDDIEGYVKRADRVLRSKIQLPEGYKISWSGDFEYIEETRERLNLIIPVTILIIFFLIYMNTRSFIKTLIVLMAVPFSLIGAFWLLYLLGYNMSLAVWVGLIALAGLDAETGVVMLLYLDIAYKNRLKRGLLRNIADLKEVVIEGAVKRLRPKMMTAGVILAGLVPVLFSSSIGSDVLKRIATPMVGGIVTSVLLELLIYPVIYMFWKEIELRRAVNERSS